jgi:hypothetical protein
MKTDVVVLDCIAVGLEVFQLYPAYLASIGDAYDSSRVDSNYTSKKYANKL